MKLVKPALAGIFFIMSLGNLWKGDYQSGGFLMLCGWVLAHGARMDAQQEMITLLMQELHNVRRMRGSH
jgi:hypothetical protein